jgi:hypothetical protein
MTLEEAVKLWVGRDFSSIPTELIKKAYRDNPEELELLSSEYPELDYPSGWGYMFHPENSLDEEWIRENISIVEECGFLIYDTEETGILLGIDGCGYSFYENHWTPLYKARDLHWHTEEKEVIKNEEY